jgi:chemotaxis protein methyltransferase CheR
VLVFWCLNEESGRRRSRFRSQTDHDSGGKPITRANLVDAQDMAGYRDFDVVFCRNVLIYFDDTSRRTAAENLYDCLRPGGYICLGHSESMSRISPLFRVCRFSDAIVYQRPEADHDRN